MDMLPTIIDSQWLKQNGACEKDYVKFCTEWPEGTAVTVAALQRATELELDVEWFAETILPPSVYAEYTAKSDPISSEYKAERLLLWDNYKAKRTLLCVEPDLLETKEEAEHTLFYKKYDVTCAPKYQASSAAKTALYYEALAELQPVYIKYRDRLNTLITSFIGEHYKSKRESL